MEEQAMRSQRWTPSIGRGTALLILALWSGGISLASPRKMFRTPNPGRARRDVTRRTNSSPLRFEVNLGQTDPDVRFMTATRSGDVFLTPGEVVLRVRKAAGSALASPRTETAVIRLQFAGANPDARITGVDPLAGQTNYFIGSDPSRGRTGVSSFARVRYEGVYPGIDLICYGNEGKLEYDFEVAPGADPSQIAMSVEGAERVRCALDWNLGRPARELRPLTPDP